MTLRRTLATASASLLLLASLTACFGIPTPNLPGGNNDPDPDPGTGTSSDLVGTSWSGVDSDGDSWGFEFQSDGTVGLTYGGNSFDDDSDTWELTDGATVDALAIHIAFDDGDIDLLGSYDGDSSIDLGGTYTGGTFTLTITED